MKHEQVEKKVTELLETLGFAEGVSVRHDEATNTLWFSLTAGDARILLGKGAEALSALNHVATKVVEKLIPDRDLRPKVVVDAGDHERKKIENLKTVAHMMAERARYFKSSISVDPMPAHERRIVHEFLSTMPDIQTESEGVGNNRHIVIRYIESKI